MEFAEASPSNSIQKFHCVSPAHLNSSPIEAWFSSVRAGNGRDSAVQYAATVGGKETTRSDLTLRNNPMYSSGDVGSIERGNYIGPTQLIKYHESREQRCELASANIMIRQSISQGAQHRHIQARRFRQNC